MLKMLIADDEPVIIRGLQMLIDWAQLSIEICATCEKLRRCPGEIFAQSPDLAPADLSQCPARPALKFFKGALDTAQSRTSHLYQRLSGFTRTMPSATVRWTIC